MNAYRRISDSLGLARFFERREPEKAIDIDERIRENQAHLEAQGWRSGQWQSKLTREPRGNVAQMRKAK